MSLDQMDTQIAEAERRLRELKESREALIAANADLYGLAEYLHTVTCKQNHTDGCGWGWEYITPTPGAESQANWAGWAHKRYLRLAHKVFVEAGLTKEEVDRALEIYNKIHEVL